MTTRASIPVLLALTAVAAVACSDNGYTYPSVDPEHDVACSCGGSSVPAADAGDGGPPDGAPADVTTQDVGAER
jgi:hypothetical protein